MTEPRRVNPRDIVIMPNRSGDCSPRFGGRAASQHDMNDAVKAAITLHDELSAREQAMKDGAAAKVEKKVVEAQSKKGASLLIMFALFEIGFVVQFLILKKLGIM